MGADEPPPESEPDSRESRSYDLREVADFVQRLHRSGTWTFGGLGLGLLVLWLVYQRNIWTQLLGSLASGGLVQAGFDVFLELALPLAAIWVLYSSLVKERLGPIRLDVGPTGLRFGFRSGREVLLSWSNPRMHLVVQDIRSRPRAVPQTALRVEVPWRVIPFAYVSGEAWDVILASAKRHGARVSEMSHREWPDYGHPVRYVSVRGSSA